MESVELKENKALTGRGGYMDEWLEYLGYGVTGETAKIKTYYKGIKNFAGFIGDMARPDRNTILQYREYLLKNYKATTAQTYMAAVKLFFQWTEYNGYYKNITENTGSFHLSNAHKKDCLTAEQVKELLQAVDRGTLTGLRDYAMLCLMATTGLRVSAVADADVQDIKPAGNSMALYYKCKGYDDRDNSVMLATQVDVAIREYMAARGAVSPDSPLFASDSNRNKGGRLDRATISATVKKYLRAIGLDSERYTAHSLRHTAATINLLNGGTLEETQQLLNHSSINTTMIYAHALQRASNESEKRIADAIFVA